MTRFVLVLAFVAAAVTACTSEKSASAPTPLPPGPSEAQLVAKAGLDPCPATQALPEAGKSLPDLTLACLGTGPEVHLSGLRGRPTVLNIWGSWCTPCQRETRYFAEVYDQAKTKVRFLGVDTEDDPKSALDFAAHVSPRMRYPQVVDNSKKLLIALRLPSAVPTTVFVSAAGDVVKVSPGPYTSSASLRSAIQRYLGVSA